MTALNSPRAILFDLDGTLADTAPDLGAAVQKLQQQRGLPQTAFEALRPMTSRGAPGLLHVAFGLTPEDAAYPELRAGFLGNYEAALVVHSRLFDGIDALLAGLRARRLHWGIVTNKMTVLTHQVLPLIGLNDADCVVCGDTTAHSKPHPEPLLEAARQLELPPDACWYVGDDERDILAARAAGMHAIAVSWGYAADGDPAQWGADMLLETPAQLLELLACTKRAISSALVHGCRGEVV